MFAVPKSIAQMRSRNNYFMQKTNIKFDCSNFVPIKNNKKTLKLAKKSLGKIEKKCKN